MATEVTLPRLGQGMESGTIVKWLKSEGDRVEKGEPLYELDTDKVTQEVEADASGVLLKIAVEGGEVDVGRTIAVIGEEGEEVPVAKSEKASVADNGAGQAEPAQTRTRLRRGAGNQLLLRVSNANHDACRSPENSSFSPGRNRLR